MPYITYVKEFLLILCVFLIVSVWKIISMCIGDVICVHYFSSSGLGSLVHCNQRTQDNLLDFCFWGGGKNFLANYSDYISVQLRNSSLESSVAFDDQRAEEAEGQLVSGTAAHHQESGMTGCPWLIQKNAIWDRFPFNSLGGIQDHGQ